MAKNWLEKFLLKESWREDAFKLLQFYKTEEWKALEIFGHHKNIMLTLTMAFIAAGFTAVIGGERTLIFFGYIVPILFVIIRYFMIRFLDRYYARFLESVVVQIKLRFVIGISSVPDPAFLEEEHLVVTRRGGKSPLPAVSTSWVRKFLEKGHNEVVSQFMTALFFVSLLLPFMVFFRLLLEESISTKTNKGPIAYICLVLSLFLALVSYYKSNKAIQKNRDKEYGKA